MIIENPGTYTLRYTATDECGNTTTADRQVVVTQNVPTVSWADGTDEQIVAMVAAADAGQIDLSDYWHVGDERVVHLDAMEATGVGESHVAQDVTLVLMNAGGKTLNTPTAGGRTTCSFIVGQKDSLTEAGYINSTNTNAGGWDACARRTWCNDVYRNAIPSTLRSIFKQVKNKTANGGSDATAAVESVDYFAMPAEYEVFGAYTYSSSAYESGLTQFEYYQTAANRIKQRNGSASYWWERSPDASSSYNFCYVSSSGTASNRSAHSTTGLAPFGCI